MGHCSVMEEVHFKTEFKTQDDLNNAVLGWAKFEAPKRDFPKYAIDECTPHTKDDGTLELPFYAVTLEDDDGNAVLTPDESYAKHYNEDTVLSLLQSLIAPGYRAHLIMQDADGSGEYYGWAFTQDECYSIHTVYYVRIDDNTVLPLDDWLEGGKKDER